MRTVLSEYCVALTDEIVSHPVIKAKGMSKALQVIVLVLLRLSYSDNRLRQASQRVEPCTF